MLKTRYHRVLGALVLVGAWSNFNAHAAVDIKTVFVIAMENHNWTQPTQVPGGIQQIYGNPNAPFVNSLVSGRASVIIDGAMVNISQQVAYATAYHNVLATPSGNNAHIHPSEPNYLWSEGGTNFGVLNDDDPFAATGGMNQNTDQHLRALLTALGKRGSPTRKISISLEIAAGNSPISLCRSRCGPFR
jgi:phosphatidylinositol-3-phosphatase